MNKIRINEWAKLNNFKSADVMKQLLAAGVKVNRMTEKVEKQILEDVVINKKNILSKKSKKVKPANKKKIKKNNYRTNVYNARMSRDLFCLDDLFEKHDLDYNLSDEMKMAIGINVSKKFKNKKGYNGHFIVNLYKMDLENEIYEFISTLI